MTNPRVSTIDQRIDLKRSSELHAGVKIWYNPYSLKETTGSVLEDTVPSKRVVAVHGWLDNAGSFDKIAPALAELGFCVLGIDLMGHGMSSHANHERSGLVSYSIENHLFFIMDVLETIKWMGPASEQCKTPRFHLMGHSLGGGLSIALAGIIPSQVFSVFSIESLGPLVVDASDTPQRIQKTFDTFKILKDKRPKVYSTKESAAQSRVESTSRFHQKLGIDAARCLVERGTRRVLTDDDIEGFEFSHDILLFLPTAFPLSQAQVDSMISNIECPITVVIAEKGLKVLWPRMGKKTPVAKMTIREAPGYHHLHLDIPEHVIQIAKEHFIVKKSSL